MAITPLVNTPSSPTTTAKPSVKTSTNPESCDLFTMGTALIGAAAPLFNGTAVNDIWGVSGAVTLPSYDPVTDSVLNSGRWGNLNPEQIDKVSDQLANFMIKTGMSVNVEAIKAQARQVLESMEPPLEESTIAEVLEGSKGLFSGNPGSLNYVDPRTGMNRIDTLLASFGEKYKDVLVQINSCSVKSEEEAKRLIESFSKEMSNDIKANFFGDIRGDGRLGLLLKELGEREQTRKNDRENNSKANTMIAASLNENDLENPSSPVAEILNV
ncbi:MAG: hypothetical protein ACKO3R_02620 [bacterium]